MKTCKETNVLVVAVEFLDCYSSWLKTFWKIVLWWKWKISCRINVLINSNSSSNKVSIGNYEAEQHLFTEFFHFDFLTFPLLFSFITLGFQNRNEILK